MRLIQLSKLETGFVSHNRKIEKKVMLANGEIDQLTNFAQSYFPPGECAPSHKHDDMSEVFFVEEGSGVITVDGVDYDLEPGTCVAISPGESHELANTGDGVMKVTYFGIKHS